MKKAVFIFAMVFASLLLASVAHAEETYIASSKSNDVTWTIDANGLLTISGSGN